MNAYKPKRQALAALLVLCMIFSMLPFSAFAETSDYEFLTYTIDSQVPNSKLENTTFNAQYNYTYGVDQDTVYHILEDVVVRLIADEGYTLAKTPSLTVSGGLKYELSEFDETDRVVAVTITVTGNYSVSAFPVNPKLTISGTLFEKADTRVDLTGVAIAESDRKVGTTLKAQVGGKDVAATDGYTFQWEESTTEKGTYSKITANATGATYTPTEDQVGKWIRVSVTATADNKTYKAGTVPSAGVQILAKDVVTTPIEKVAISGAAKVGETLTASVTPTGATVSYKWQCSVDKNSWTDIPGATYSTYVPTAEHGGMYIRVVATGTGTYTGTVNAEAVGPVELLLSARVSKGEGYISTVAIDAKTDLEGADHTGTIYLKGSVAASETGNVYIQFLDSANEEINHAIVALTPEAEEGGKVTANPTTVEVRLGAYTYKFAVNTDGIEILPFEYEEGDSGLGDIDVTEAVAEVASSEALAEEGFTAQEANDAKAALTEIMDTIKEKGVETNVSADQNVRAAAKTRVNKFVAEKGIDESQYDIKVETFLKVEPQTPQKITNPKSNISKTAITFNITPMISVKAVNKQNATDIIDGGSESVADVNDSSSARMDQEVEVDVPLGDFVPDTVAETAVAVRHNGSLIWSLYEKVTQAVRFWASSFSPFSVEIDERVLTIVSEVKDEEGNVLDSVTNEITINDVAFGVTLEAPDASEIPAGKRFGGWVTPGGISYPEGKVLDEDLFEELWNDSEAADGAKTATVTLTAALLDQTSGGSGGGGGGGGSSSSTVSISGSKNGSVSVSPRNAKKGETVTITAKPNKGYVVGTVTVTDKNGNPVTVTLNADGTCSFVMPEATPVTITVDFVEETPAAPTVSNPFYDVPAGAYYYDAVMWAIENNITAGMTATSFGPNEPCTRAQIVTFLWRAAGSPKASGSNPFTDVSATEYYYDAVQWAVANGITAGTSDTTFSPSSTCTRAQAVSFIYRANSSPAVSGSNSFTDLASGAYYTSAVQWAVANGITAGTSDTTFSPDDTCTRAQIVSFMYRDR